MTQTLDRPPAVEVDRGVDARCVVGPSVPEVLIKEARRRQRHRWMLSGLVFAAAGSLVSGLAMTILSPPPGPPGPGGTARPPAPISSGRPETKPVPSLPDAAPPRLVNIAFFNPTSGYGVFTAGWTRACRVEVAMTSDGGATFETPVEVAPCSVGVSALAFDDHGDGFLYGAASDRLYVTHSGGSAWSAERERGDVLSVEALGYSVWMLLAECSEAGAAPAHPCQLAVRESTNGGLTWRTSASQPRSSPPVPVDPASLEVSSG